MRRRLAGWGFAGVAVSPPAALLGGWRSGWPGSAAPVVPPRLDASCQRRASCRDCSPPPRHRSLSIAWRTRAAGAARPARGCAPAGAGAARRRRAPAEDELDAACSGRLRRGGCRSCRAAAAPRSPAASTCSPAIARPLVLDLEPLAGLLGLDAESRLATFGAGTRGPAVEAALGAVRSHPRTPAAVVGAVDARRLGGDPLGGAGVARRRPHRGPRRRPRAGGAGGAADAAGAARLGRGPRAAAAGDGQRGAARRGDAGDGAGAAGAAAPRGDRLAAARVGRRPAAARGSCRSRCRSPCCGSPTPPRRRPPCSSGSAMGVPGHVVAPLPLVARRGGGVPAAGRRRRRDGERRQALGGAARRCGGTAACRWAGPGRRWLADRFRHPYLRDGLLDAGYAGETLETCALVAVALDRGWWRGSPPRSPRSGSGWWRSATSPTLTADGASLYSPASFACRSIRRQRSARWATLKRRRTTSW